MSSVTNKQRTARVRVPPTRRARRGDDPQMVRLLKLLVALAQTRRGINLAQFASERGYGERAIFRDRRTLEAAGIPIEKSNGLLKLPDGWIPPSATGATRDEILALFIAR